MFSPSALRTRRPQAAHGGGGAVPRRYPSAFNNFNLTGAGDQQRGRNTDEQSVLDHARNGAERGGEFGGALDCAESAVADQIAAIGLESFAVLLAQAHRHG